MFRATWSSMEGIHMNVESKFPEVDVKEDLTDPNELSEVAASQVQAKVSVSQD